MNTALKSNGNSGGVQVQIAISRPQEHLGIIYERIDSLRNVLRSGRKPQRIRDHVLQPRNEYKMTPWNDSSSRLILLPTKTSEDTEQMGNELKRFVGIQNAMLCRWICTEKGE